MVRPDAPVSDVMRQEFVSLKSTDRLDFADDIMKLGRIRHMPVLDGEKLVGIVSQRDLLAASLSRALDFEPEQRRTFLRSVEVAEVMTRNVVSVSPDTPLGEVARLMIRHKVGCIPVVSASGTPLGIATETDMLRAAYDLTGEYGGPRTLETD
jgi:CBS domain-containing protein